MTEKSRKFVDTVIDIAQREDTAMRAKLSRADNSATEYQSWEFLARWGIDLTKPERKAYALIAAAIAHSRPQKNTELGLGTALRMATIQKQEQVSKEELDSPRLRRILSCQNQGELIDILRSVLRYLKSKEAVNIDYARLLDEIRFFNIENRRERTKALWAQEFYSRNQDSDNTEATGDTP